MKNKQSWASKQEANPKHMVCFHCLAVTTTKRDKEKEKEQIPECLICNALKQDGAILAMGISDAEKDRVKDELDKANNVPYKEITKVGAAKIPEVYLTGRLLPVKRKKLVKELRGKLSQEDLAKILKRRFVFINESTWLALGIPSGDESLTYWSPLVGKTDKLFDNIDNEASEETN